MPLRPRYVQAAQHKDASKQSRKVMAGLCRHLARKGYSSLRCLPSTTKCVRPSQVLQQRGSVPKRSTCTLSGTASRKCATLLWPANGHTALEAPLMRTTIIILHNPEITVWYKTGEKGRLRGQYCKQQPLCVTSMTQLEHPINVRKLVTVLPEVCTRLAWSINYKPASSGQR